MTDFQELYHKADVTEFRNKVLAAINTDELDHIFDTDGVFEN